MLRDGEVDGETAEEDFKLAVLAWANGRTPGVPQGGTGHVWVDPGQEGIDLETGGRIPVS